MWLNYTYYADNINVVDGKVNIAIPTKVYSRMKEAISKMSAAVATVTIDAPELFVAGLHKAIAEGYAKRCRMLMSGDKPKLHVSFEFVLRNGKTITTEIIPFEMVAPSDIIDIYTHTVYNKNNRGGIASICVQDGIVIAAMSRTYKNTTSYRLHTIALLEALRLIPKDTIVVLHINNSFQSYLLNRRFETVKKNVNNADVLSKLKEELGTRCITHTLDNDTTVFLNKVRDMAERAARYDKDFGVFDDRRVEVDNNNDKRS